MHFFLSLLFARLCCCGSCFYLEQLFNTENVVWLGYTLYNQDKNIHRDFIILCIDKAKKKCTTVQEWEQDEPGDGRGQQNIYPHKFVFE
jgi:agmatine/peptidylarginine deiminase